MSRAVAPANLRKQPSTGVSSLAMASVKVYGKRVRETSTSTSNAGRNVRSTCDLDLDILECPICTEALSPPVYQCRNGHPLCSACHAKISKCPSCSEEIGATRNLLAEKIIDSLQVKCNYAPNGCKQMLKYNTREEHIKNLCTYRPYPCPVLECMHEGPKQTLAQHLEREHDVRTAPLQLNTTSGFSVVRLQMVPTDVIWRSRFVLLIDAVQKVKLPFHRESIETLGHMFFCTTFEDHAMKYDLQISSIYSRESCTTISNSSAEDILCKENWRKDALLFYTGGSTSGIIVTLSLHTHVQVDDP